MGAVPDSSNGKAVVLERRDHSSKRNRNIARRVRVPALELFYLQSWLAVQGIEQLGAKRLDLVSCLTENPPGHSVQSTGKQRHA